MREYETTLLIQPEISEEGRQAIFDRLDSVLGKAGGARLLYEDWGKRKLAYELKKFQKAHYILLQYLDEGGVVPELERSLRLDESVLRFMTVLVADRVTDVEARKARAVEEERIQTEKAAERTRREAEEQEARDERAREEAERVAAEAVKAAEAAQAAEAEAAEESEAEEAPGPAEEDASTGEAPTESGDTEEVEEDKGGDS